MSKVDNERLTSMALIVPFSFARIAEFTIPDLNPTFMSQSVLRLEHAFRREALFAESAKSSPEWLSRAAEYFYDLGLFAESDSYSNRLGIAGAEAEDDRVLARAYLWQCLCAVSSRSTLKLLKRIEQLISIANRTPDPFVRATLLLAKSLAYEKCSSWESPISIAGEDDWCNVFVAYKEAAQLFADLGEVDLAILCHVEYALSKIAHGEYLTSIEWTERGLSLAKEHDKWKWCGRLLQVAASAATDQGYRQKVESTLLQSIAWAEYIGDEWGRIEALIGLARLQSFEIPALDPKQAGEPAAYLTQAISSSEAAGFPWLRDRAQHALKFLMHKSGLATSPYDLSDSLERGRIEAKLDIDIRKRVTSRLEDGVGDSPDAFLVFNALRNEEAVCEDFVNEYRNAVGGHILNRGPAYVVMFSEFSDSPYLKGLTTALFDATERRQTYEDLVEIVDGNETAWFRRRVTPSGDGAVVKLRNVTAERRIEEALINAAESARRSERTMSEFLANMSHEIRTPISGVLGLAQMLAETRLDEAQREYVDSILGSGTVLLGLIGDILDLSKIEAGFFELTPEPTDIRSLIAGIAGLYRGAAERKGVSVSFNITKDVPEAILVDGLRLRQVLANIVGNAVKFTPSGTVKIEVVTDGDSILYQVADSGIGISHTELEAIFGRFEQASGGRRAQNGSGLGLTISLKLIELMGGSIDVQSTPGVGTQFSIKHPLVPAVVPVAIIPKEVPSRFEHARILLVDDNQVNLAVARHVLHKLGCKVQCLSDGTEAVEALDTIEVDLVFMDIRMPLLNGLDATRRIREREARTGKHVPIVALTAGAMAEERDRCFEAGMDDYISKPFVDESLRSILARWIPQTG